MADSPASTHSRAIAHRQDAYAAQPPEYRIYIYGGACSGKSHVARWLGQLLGIPVLHLDDVFWYGDWQMRSAEELLNAAAELARRDSWIIEGNYRAVRDHLAAHCTHIVYMDVPLIVAVYRAIRRSLSRDRHGVPRDVRAATSRRESAPALIRMIWRHWRRRRAADLAFLEMVDRSATSAAIARSPEDLQRFLAR